MKSKNLLLGLFILATTISYSQKEKIIGNWQLTTVEVNNKTETDLKAVFIFADKGVLKAARSATSKTIKVGSWEYNKKKKTIVMTSTLDRDFNGKALVTKVNKNELVYKKDGATLRFLKLKKMNSPIKTEIKMKKPILSFERDEMYNENEEFNYEEAESKLPWKIEMIVNYLKDYNEMIYEVTHFPDNEEPNASVESEKINYNETEQTIDVREYSYFQNDYIDMMEDPILMNSISEYDYDYNFFPKDNLDLYKVIGLDKIETSAGIFECTVIEGYGRFDDKIKYWMVNNQPGVFAKIIKVKDAPVPYGSTNVYLLKEIK